MRATWEDEEIVEEVIEYLPSSSDNKIERKVIEEYLDDISTTEKERANATQDSILGERLMMKTGGGFKDIEEDSKRHKDVYISKLDTIIKTELSSIRQLWKKKENLELEIADNWAMTEEMREDQYKLI